MTSDENKIITDKCRVCGQSLFGQPLLRYENMPSTAQCFPDAETVKNDKGIDLNICQCSGCGLIQLNSEPVPYYKEVIRATFFSEEMKEFRRKQFSNFIKKYSLQGKKIIEVGSGCGENLFIMSQCGVKVFGLEYSENSVEQCLKGGLSVSKGFVGSDDYKIDNAPFDAFFTLSFIEHLPELNQTLRGIRNNLSEGAVGIVEVPNFDMILRNKLFSEFTRDHLFYFTRETLISTLKLNGFETVECGEIWHDYIISAIVKPVKNYQAETVLAKKTEKMDLSYFYDHQSKLKDEIEKYVSQFPDKQIAVWGAGHQALAVISMLGLGDKIKYVVDSAVFKQGKFTPATHIPIVAPDMLDSDHVDAIIVIAGSYSDEVAKIIQKMYKKSINISILMDFGLKIW